MNDKILVIGDLHGNWIPLNILIAKKRPDIILQCGDYGYWPKWHNTRGIGYPKRQKKWNLYGLKPGKTKIYWCDGNHEDHWAIKEIIETGNCEIQPNIFYQPRGSTIELPDGRKVLFMGGGESIDKEIRTIGIDWFPEETITQSDIKDLPDEKIDIIISHTCTIDMYRSIMNIKPDNDYRILKGEDPSLHGLQFIFEQYKPDLWYFGHFHLFMKGKIRDTNWTALDMPQNIGRWWFPLEK